MFYNQNSCAEAVQKQDSMKKEKSTECLANAPLLVEGLSEGLRRRDDKKKKRPPVPRGISGHAVYFLTGYILTGLTVCRKFFLYQWTGPNRSSGQTVKTIFPTICSSATQPTEVFRESMETARLSPITKILESGTW